LDQDAGSAGSAAMILRKIEELNVITEKL